MERRLSGEAQRRPAVPEAEWDAVDDLGVVDSSAMGRLELALEILARLLAAEEQVALDALEVALDVFHRRNGFDAVNRRHVALGGDAGAFLAMHFLDVEVPVVGRGGGGGGGTAALPPADRAVIDYHYGAPGPREQVGGRQTGNAGSDDADIDPHVLRKRLELRDFGGTHPDRGRVTRVAMHERARAIEWCESCWLRDRGWRIGHAMRRYVIARRFP